MKRLFYAMGLMFGFQTFANAATDCNAVTEIPVNECKELLNLYNTTNGANWTNKTGWNQTNTPCSWFGVTCNGGRVERLELNSNNLVGTLPDLNLPNLWSLRLNQNQLSGNIPNFSNLPKLTSLQLNRNQLSGNIPNFTNSPNLRWLELGQNQLSGSIPNFTNSPNLRLLELSQNQLSGSIPNFTSFDLANFQKAFFNNNCGLTAFDSAQETMLNQEDPIWKTQNPNCGTTCVDTNGSTQEGINLVKSTPSDYGLFTQTQIDAAKQTASQDAINKCKLDPASCGIVISD